jgi:arabinogalactan oligomer/maltooligosaccharide transport system permease protein
MGMNPPVVEPAVSKRGKQPKRTLAPGERILLWVSRLIIWIVILMTLIPMWFVAEASFNPSNAYFSVSLFPAHPSLGNYIQLFSQTQFLTWVRNSLVVGLATGLGQVLFTATAAFAFSKLRFWGRKYGLMSLLLLQMFPNFLAIAAIYTGLSHFNLIDNLPAYVLVLLGGSAFNVWLLKGYFDSIPRELDEAAIIDGANSWQRFTRILLPLAMPMLVVIFLFTLMGTFSEYMIAGTILQSPENYTIGVGMFGMISQKFAQNWGEFAAAALLSAIPLAVIFGLLQKFVASGLVAGSVKG